MKSIFIFRYCCLTAIKHCTTGSVCFQTLFGYKIKFVQSRKQFYASVCNMFAMSIADVLLFVDFSVSRKMSYWQCCCSCLLHGGIKANTLVVEHFGVCCALCGLQCASSCCTDNCIGIATSVSTSSYFETKNNGMCIIISFV